MKNFILFITTSFLAVSSTSIAMQPTTYSKKYTTTTTLVAVPKSTYPQKNSTLKPTQKNTIRNKNNKNETITDSKWIQLDKKYSCADNYQLLTDTNKKQRSNKKLTSKTDVTVADQNLSQPMDHYNCITNQNRITISLRNKGIIYYNLIKNSLTSFNAVYRSPDAHSLLRRIKEDGYTPYKSSEDHENDHVGYHHPQGLFYSSQDLYEIHSQASISIINQLITLLSATNSCPNNSSINALNEISFLFKYSAPHHIDNSIFKNSATWQSYNVPDKSVFTKRKLAKIALLLIENTVRSSKMDTSNSYDNLLELFNHIKAVTTSTKTTAAFNHPVKTMRKLQKTVIPNPIASRTRSAKNADKQEESSNNHTK